MNQTAVIDGLLLREMVLSGAAQLEKNREMVDALNVFPVPDGDTGTNMNLTMSSAIREINQNEYTQAGKAAEALSRGALRGARGNSGVILSQILRGFSKEIAGAETISPTLFANALKRGADTAYKAVMKPKEGTILTVARVLAEDAVRQAAAEPEDFDGLFSVILRSGEAILQRTPEMLPVLKEAGVVDAGGRGLMFILSGFYQALRGGEAVQEIVSPQTEAVPDLDSPFVYSQDFVLRHIKETVTEESMTIFRRQLNRIGQSVQVNREGDRISCHLLTNEPGKAIQFGLDIGEITEHGLVNLREEYRREHPEEAEEEPAAPENPAEKKPFGFVSVSLGEGFAEIFRDLKVDVIVDGGQTMNPSIEDIHNAIETVNAETVYILPNNGNVILAAQQAAEIADTQVRVIPTKNVAMGIAAIIAFQPDQDADTNAAVMEEASQCVRTGTITFAVRDTKYEGMDIQEGDIIGLNNGKLSIKGSSVDEVALQLMEDIVTEDDGLITLYYGKDTTEESAEALREKISERYPDLDVEALSGGQPLYYYLISVE